MTEPQQQTELERAYATLEQARARRDIAAIGIANREIKAIRDRISATRRRLASLVAERIHLCEVVERARIQLLRYERHMEDHDRRISQLREELRQIGGRIRDQSGTELSEDPLPFGETAIEE